MSHLSQDNKKLLQRVRRLKGQIEGVERMLQDDADCMEILQTVAACRGAFNGLTRQLIHEHIEHHLLEDAGATKSVRQAGKEIQTIIDSYLK
ncbi:MAG: metal/formaldehyde-sensitive transcriptional repressor [Opitutaceae bacterium]